MEDNIVKNQINLVPVADTSRIIIHNPVSCHYECIESVIHYLPFILRDKYNYIKNQPEKPTLVLNIVQEPGFIRYITTYKTKLLARYGFNDIIINIINDVGYIENPDINKIVQLAEPGEIRIFLTIPGGEFLKPEIFNWPNTYYILHNYRQSIITPANVFYLAPHCKHNLPNNYFIPDILPFSAKSVSYPDRPEQISISQGAWILIQGRLNRRIPALIKILIKFVSATLNGQISDIQPANLVILTKTNNLGIHNSKNIHMINNSDFWTFHQWAAKCNIIATLVSQQTHHKYYTSKLTSSVSYGIAYNMRFLIDSDLYNIYSDHSSGQGPRFQKTPNKEPVSDELQLANDEKLLALGQNTSNDNDSNSNNNIDGIIKTIKHQIYTTRQEFINAIKEVSH